MRILLLLTLIMAWPLAPAASQNLNHENCRYQDMALQDRCQVAYAIKNGDLARAGRILDGSYYIDVNDLVYECDPLGGRGRFLQCGISPVRFVETAIFLLDRGYDLRWDSAWASPIQYVIDDTGAPIVRRLDLLQRLLQLGFDPNAVEQKTSGVPRKEFPLIWVVAYRCDTSGQPEIFDAPVASGAKLDTVRHGNTNILHWFAQYGGKSCSAAFLPKILQQAPQLLAAVDTRGWLPIEYFGHTPCGDRCATAYRRKCSFKSGEYNDEAAYRQAFVSAGSSAGRTFQNNTRYPCSIGDAHAAYRVYYTEFPP